MSASYATRLDQVREAKVALIGAMASAQALEVTFADGRKVRRHDFAATLDALTREETMLIGQVARTTRQGGISITRGAGG